MIERERLEELVKENKPIWYYLGGTPTGQPTISQMGALDYVMMQQWYENNLFESEEDLEFWLNYETIQRVETLKLPTWEEFNKERYFEFVGADNTWYEIIMSYNKILMNYSTDGEYFVDYYDWKKIDATKENYFEACRLAKKLFLGESKC